MLSIDRALLERLPGAGAKRVKSTGPARALRPSIQTANLKTIRRSSSWGGKRYPLRVLATIGSQSLLVLRLKIQRYFHQRLQYQNHGVQFMRRTQGELRASVHPELDFFVHIAIF